jgi:hypothetical protein
MADAVYTLDSVRVTTSTGGTGALAIGGVPTGYLDPFSAGAVSGRRYTWRCQDEANARWEIFEGVLTAGNPSTIARNRIVRNNTGGTSAINWEAGTTKLITCLFIADRLPYLNTDGQVPYPLLPSALISRLISTIPVAIPSGVQGLMSWNAKGDDGLFGGGVIVPTSGFTVAEAGIYMIEGSVTFAANANGGVRSVALTVDGNVKQSKQFAPNGLPITMDLVYIDALQAGQVVQMVLAQNSGAALNAGGNGYDHLTIARMRA